MERAQPPTTTSSLILSLSVNDNAVILSYYKFLYIAFWQLLTLAQLLGRTFTFNVPLDTRSGSQLNEITSLVPLALHTMASTPPLQILSTPQTPLTPLHGAAYDRRPTRASSRIAARQVQSTLDAPQRTLQGEATVTTPKSSRQSRTRQIAPGIHSPESTPRNKTSRRVQVISPSSPDTDTLPPKSMARSKAHLQPFASSSTTISDGMLPTPVKTPKKKVVNKANNAARALFQDNPDMVDFEPSPRKVRKGKRYNGFSLESFSAENEGGSGQIQIYTDSRDRVPQADGSQSNPFVEHEMNGGTSTSRKVAGTSKRRKVSGERREVDSQVAAAIEEDDGMVYVL